MKYLKLFEEHIFEGRILWSKEKCQEEALKYNSRNEFHVNSGSAYYAANKNGWLDDVCSHMIPIRNYKGYWTKERCQEEALKYNNRRDFSKGSGSAYSKAATNGWLGDICKHMGYLGNKIKRFVYIYTFPDESIYVGLTSDTNRRHIAHTSFSNRKSAVYTYIISSGLTPELKILTPEPIDINDAVKMEIDLIAKYREDGYNVLNISNGGDVGGSNIIWTKEKCQEEALKYNNKSDFMNGCGPAYSASHRNGWIDEICSHMTKKKVEPYWTKERCQEEALKYDKRYKFKIGSRGAQNSAYMNGWLDDICSHMDKQANPSGTWTKEKCQEEALKYNNIRSFSKGSGGAHGAARRHGWMDEICSHMNKRDVKEKGYWTKERCHEEALKYKTRTNFINGSSSAQVAQRNGWMDEICSHMVVIKRPPGYWTKERCHEEALKYKTITAFMKGSAGAEQTARRNGWMDEICSHMKKRNE